MKRWIRDFGTRRYGYDRNLRSARKDSSSGGPLAEAIERRKLEQATGKIFEPLPSVVFSDDRGESREKENKNERERAKDGQAGKEVNLAYDALNMI